jgi:catechol 2,3-dioxygenase-like lactoylglutathione lyase family enzyme
MDTSINFQVLHIDHVELFVPDFEAALEWYREVLGLVPVEMARLWADEGQPHMISSDGGTTMLALFQGEGPGEREFVGHQRVAFRVDAAGFMDFLDHIERVAVENRHGEPLTRAQVVDHDLAWSIYFRDPWGNPYEITSYDYDAIRAALTNNA